MNSQNNHYYTNTSENYIRQTFLDFNLYTYDTFACLYMHIDIDNIKNSHILKRINNKVYLKLIKHFKNHTITFIDKPNYMIIYIYDESLKNIERKYMEFYEYIHKIKIPLNNHEYSIKIKSGIVYSQTIKDPLYMLEYAYKQYINLSDKYNFLSLLHL